MSLERPLALRRFKEEARATSQQRVIREARVCAGIAHPNVLEVYEVGDDRGAYVAMELLSGESLEARLERAGSLPLPDVARLGAEVLGALRAAHAAGAIHPALSLDDIFIAEHRGGRTTKLAGFAPIGDDDPRDDLHAAGRAIYTALTGEAPPAPEDARLPLGPSEVRTDVGLDADAFATRALAATIDARFQSADEMLDAWQSIEALSPHLSA